MIYSIDYYTYEYAVFRGLTEVFKEITITLSSDTYKAYSTIRDGSGDLKQKVVSQFDGDRNITVNLINDFKVGVEEKLLINDLNNNVPIETVTQNIVELIKSEWLEQICK